MCGIAGIVTLDGAPIDSAVLKRMSQALRHRGPDAEGFYVAANGTPCVGLVHRRLSIIDLSTVADAPLPNEDGTVQAMLNGEIYNFQELRRDLVNRHTFRSRGDTEVIVHGYEERGDAIVGELDGMFALALWDGRHRRLLLARDPFGKKPLYYWHDSRRLVFGSEIKALFAAGVPAEMDDANWAEYLAFGYVPTPRSMFKGIRKLEPASTLVVDGHGVGPPKRYWDLRFPREEAVRKVTAAEAEVRVRELLTAAVRKRLIADVPLGILLSGGVDSSAVAAIAAKLVSGRVKTFTVGFQGDAFYDERAPAERMARHIGAEHYASVVKPDAAALMETLLDHHDEPFGDSSALPTYLVAREAREHVTVVLNGDGGDETFAGYDRFYAALLADAIPAPVRQALRLGSRLLPEGSTYHGTLRRIRRFAGKAALPFDERIFAWSVFFDLPALREIALNGLVDRDRVLSSYRETLDACAGASLLSRLLYLNVRTYLLDDLLPKMDRMTMAHGLEARSPLLDRDLMTYVATLPDDLKRRGGQGKVILKRAVADLVPAEIIERPKHGFGVPLGDWFRGELRALVEELLLDRPRLGRRLRAEAIRALVDDHMSGRGDRGHQLWTLLMLELWLRKHRFE
jgi:asparagine synthase (glutamine-hydrolysing)